MSEYNRIPGRGDDYTTTAKQGLGDTGGKKKPDEHLAAANSDFEALEKLRRLAFAEEVPAPQEVQRLLPGIEEDVADDK